MKLNFYINFDFGLRGDYKGFYKWLDKNKAEERGNGYALIREFEFPDQELIKITDGKNKNVWVIDYLKKDIQKYAEIGSSDRIYLTLKSLFNDNLGGIFLFGKKQASPWEGHYLTEGETEMDFE